ncbi:hypothetical protein GCM10027446_34200 [Angustibacter peucedani]
MDASDLVLDVVGWGGSALVVWSLLQSRILRLRWLNLAGSLVLMGFNVVIGVWPMVGLNAALAVINVVQLRKLLATRHDATTYGVVEVAPDDAFLAHLLRAHAADIAATAPDFRGLDGADLVAIVMDADHPVGVVVARDAGGGTAQVDLDWVTPRYRDFTPGEFVYRRSDLFESHGFVRVVAPPRTAGTRRYLDRVGFRGDPPVLELDVEHPR